MPPLWASRDRSRRGSALPRSTRFGLGGSCADSRHVADKTPHDGPSRLTATEHPHRAELRTVQHYRARVTTDAHGRLTSAKPPSPVRLRSPPPTTSLHTGTFWCSPRAHFLPIRQNCRHSADETPRHQRTQVYPACSSTCSSAHQRAAPPVSRSSGVRRSPPLGRGRSRHGLADGRRAQSSARARDARRAAEARVPGTGLALGGEAGKEYC
jgi:hypothetical protein